MKSCKSSWKKAICGCNQRAGVGIDWYSGGAWNRGRSVGVVVVVAVGSGGLWKNSWMSCRRGNYGPQEVFTRQLRPDRGLPMGKG